MSEQLPGNCSGASIWMRCRCRVVAFTQNQTTSLTMKRILFVDDDVDLLAAMKIFLQQQGYEVAVTTSCSEGLKIFETFHPHLILLDINVGGEDGRLMCRQIKEEAEYEHIPVILISANDDALTTYDHYGADDFIVKPFDPFDLAETLHVHL
jgi:DNA-binding response OmpR family regulator